MLQNLRTTSEGEEVIAVYQPTVDDFIKVNFESLYVLSQLHPLHERRLFSSRRDSITPPLQPTVPSPHLIRESLLRRRGGQQITH